MVCRQEGWSLPVHAGTVDVGRHAAAGKPSTGYGWGQREGGCRIPGGQNKDEMGWRWVY